MQRISDTQKCMASLAVFRQLYESQKNIYSVISEFANQIILNNGIWDKVDLGILMNCLKHDYGFEVPMSVLKNAVKKLSYVTITNGKIIIDNEKKILAKKTLADYQEVVDKNEKIKNLLITYVEDITKQTLSIDERKVLIKDFCSYIINEDNSLRYGKYIYSFILKYKEDKDFVERLELIRDGVISFVGLSYQTNDNQIDILDEHLTIYLDMEILFHLAGYNGELYQKLFDEFYNLVDQINKNNGKKRGKEIITLKYFQETKQEIEDYFNTAETIIRNGSIRDKSKTAMTNILAGCKSGYQIREK